MDWIAAAVADLRVSLKVASATYARFSESGDIGDKRPIFLGLSAERGRDAENLARAATSAELDPIEPTVDERAAGEILGFGNGIPSSLRSIIYRVQRAENRLAKIVSHLRTVTRQSVLRIALSEIGRHIANRRSDIQALRREVAVTEARLGSVSSFAPQVEQIQGREFTVWFGTNRARERSGRFIGERGEEIHYGRCKVFVPDNREIGSLGSGWLGRLIWGDDRIKLTRTDRLTAHELWVEIQGDLQLLEPMERHALVFLHGYCVTFQDAARRTAQLKADLAFRGPAAFFSWPSLGAKYGYPNDAAAIQGSEAALREFLIDFSVRSGANAVHIIAHSMGNQGLLRAINAIAQDASAASRARFGQIILAAPDVDRELFASLAAAYVKLARRATLYVSENDLAIDVSVRIHRFARAGLAPPVTVIPGIDTVNVSKINLGLLGHSYATEVRTVLSDIHELLVRNTPPEGRFGLREAEASTGKHWIFAA